ncbi:MAG: hypothetical protein JWQ88_2057 [Rhodoferax sp.]|jgi:uncharacterized repeat protein (TIGR01451 family)|nr:hypothetical protein [Rhodoferax sp.]
MQFSTFIGIFVALSWSLLSHGTAHAFGPSQCAASRFGSDLNCTANDVSITAIKVVGGGATSCTGGQSITLDLDVTVQFASPDRWDIGIFISSDGKSPQLLPANGGAASCKVAILPTPSILATSPFVDLDPGPWNGTRDSCGDGNAGIRGGSGNGVLRMTGVTVPCQALASTGKLYIPFVVSWDNQSSPSGATCTSINDPVPNTKSKCNAPLLAQGSVDVVVLPSITKTDGLTQITPGDATSYTISLINTTGIELSTANNNAAVFKDPAVSNLNVSSVTCSASGGAVCPTAGTVLTVAAMQSASGIPIDMPANSTVVFTVNAQLTGNPTGTLTNSATVSANGQTNSASDTNTIVYPSLVNMKTVAVTSDPVNGTSNPKSIPGAEVLYNLRVTNTGAGTADTNTVVLIDPIPANTELFVGNLKAAGSGPIVFEPGSSALTWAYASLTSLTDDVNFSNNHCTSFSYVPVPTLDYDPAVNCIRLNPKGKLAGASAGSNPYFELRFQVRIK